MTFVALSNWDREHLIVTFETSLQINKRSQFYLWSQGALQGFIAHQTLFCVYGDIERMRFKYESFSSELPNAQAERDIGDPANGLLPRIVDDWLRAGSVPRLYSPDGDSQVGRRQLLADLKRRGFGHVIAHGAKGIQGDYGSFFAFVRLPSSPGTREMYLLELLMPYLHMTLHRMLASEKGSNESQSSAATLLSRREIQVLHWVKNGKTNNEIGQILNISPPTVKNHVQNIMRKLNVSNRAQAVGKGSTLRLVAPGESVS
jgi:transcriptional regulator EpsA